MIRKLPRLRRRLCRDESGLALVEFAMSLPILLTLGLGGIELSHYALAVERSSQIAMLVADNAARVRDSIDEVNINEVMSGAKFVGEGVKFAQNGRIILSSLEMNAAKNGQWIRWQRCAGAKAVSSSYGVQDKGKTDSSLQGMGPTGNKVSAADGTALMFVEVFYDYQPIVPVDYLGVKNRTLHFTAAFNVRQRTNQALNNASNLSGSKLSSCGLYSA